MGSAMHAASSALAGLTIALAMSGCSSSNSEPAEYDDPDIAGRNANPDGVAYPTDHIGGTQRAAGRPGDRIPNYTFMAYIDGNEAAGLQPVSLADYYDPTSKRFKILDLQISATWCSVCSAVTTATVPVKAQLATEGAVFLEVVVAGASQSAGPSLAEVDAWVTSHSSNLTTAIDVRAHRLGNIGVDPELVPYDILIDLRTMEILDASPGAPMNFDIASYAHEGLQFVAKNKPSY
jgi:hypothetical protein